MKNNLMKIAAVAACAAVGMSLAACGAASSTASSAAASSAAASSAAASELTGEQSTTYTLQNASTGTIPTLYFYETGSTEKGDNLAGTAGLAVDGTVDVTVKCDASEMKNKAYTIEFVGADGETYTFDHLSFETLEAPIKLLGADLPSGATEQPISFK